MEHKRKRHPCRNANQVKGAEVNASSNFLFATSYDYPWKVTKKILIKSYMSLKCQIKQSYCYYTFMLILTIHAKKDKP